MTSRQNGTLEQIFLKHWSLVDLRRVDPGLHEALLDQQRLLAAALAPDEVAVHTAAMARGWKAAVERMELNEIAKIKIVFPGAEVIATRAKHQM